MEDKLRILRELVPVLRLTRNLHDLKDLQLTKSKAGEFVIAIFESNYTRIADVTADSGTAMIKDIINQIV